MKYDLIQLEYRKETGFSFSVICDNKDRVETNREPMGSQKLYHWYVPHCETNEELIKAKTVLLNFAIEDIESDLEHVKRIYSKLKEVKVT